MADRYHNTVTQVLTAGTAFTYTHGLTANGSQVAPDSVVVTPEHGASIGANSFRITNKATDVCSIIMDKEINPTGSPVAITCRVDAIYWPSNLGR